MFEMAACGLLRTLDNGVIVRVNPTFCAWIGRPAEVLVGRRRFQDLLTMGGRIFHQTHWAPLLRMQGTLAEVKLDLLHEEGASIPMVLNARRHEADGVVVHDIAAFVARDRDTYEKELVLARKRLESAVAEAERLQEESKDRAHFAEQMIGIVSHDLRNPLAAIAMGAGLLADGDLSEEERGAVERISRSTARATRLIVDLLDFTQARLGRGLRVSAEPTDVHAAVFHALEELAVVFPARKTTHVRNGAGPARADAQRLAQLVGNLVTNAFAYGAADGVVTVTSSVGSDFVALAVHNHGPPISETVQRTMFRPMERGPTDSHHPRSVGLGLFIVREIARAHGGRAEVTSTASGGTTFSVVFPRR